MSESSSSTDEPLHIRIIQQPTEWQEAAACLNRPYEWFQLPDQMTTEVGDQAREDIPKGIKVCAGCPVAAQCLAEATVTDLFWTVRGGKWPGGLSRSSVGRPPAIGTNRPHKGPWSYPEGPCRRGHDRSVTGICQTGECYACRRYRDYCRAHPEAPVPPVTPYWENMDECHQGHTLRPVEERTGAFCDVCVVERKREDSRKRHERVMRSPEEAQAWRDKRNAYRREVRKRATLARLS